MFNHIKRFVYKADDIASYVAAGFIFLNMAVVTYSVIMRLLFKSPIAGLTDIVSFVSAINAALALGFTEKGHGFIKVDFVAEYFPKMLQRILHVVMSLVSIAIIGLASWRMLLYAVTTYRSGTITSIMFLPYWPIAACIFIGLLTFFLTTVVDAVDVVIGWKGGEKK